MISLYLQPKNQIVHGNELAHLNEEELMTTKTISLEYDGYWREQKIASIPARSGVYTVYACKHNASEKTVTIRKLIYIGESENVRERIQGHEKWQKWRQHLQSGEVLCFNFAPIVADRVRAEAALINYHKPPENTEYVNNFPFDTTTIRTTGRNRFVKDYFTVYRSQRSAIGFY